MPSGLAQTARFRRTSLCRPGTLPAGQSSSLTHPEWVTVASRIPRAVICLISALAHHGLTTQIPHNVDIALPSHAQVPRVQGVPIRVFWFANGAFDAGVDVITIDRVPVKIYSMEKTIADCFKYRNKIGIDVAVEALRTYRGRVRRLRSGSSS
jgi:predicted transcriptional regulator of viral defense system